ncbi:MAG: hypothetical protein JSS99_07365 [Actinobacteria bacterium]|nr:hypothetical protein [Actinomycetota bacterium]
MRTGITVALATAAAALLLALAVGSASANRLSYSEQSFRIVWTRLIFSEAGGGFPINCPVTLEGSFHARTFTKTRDQLSGYITNAVVNNAGCTEGHATILRATLPWHVTFQSFTGTLPNITGVRYDLIGAAFQIEPGLGIVCLASSSVTSPAAGNASREAGGNITSLQPDSSLAIPVTGALCPEAGIFSGSGEVYVQGSSERRVRLTLI